MKRIVRLTERDLHNIISESVNRILSEMHYDDIEPSDGDLEDSIFDDDDFGNLDLNTIYDGDYEPEEEDFSYKELSQHPENDFPELSLAHRSPVVQEPVFSANSTYTRAIPENSDVTDDVEPLNLKVFLCHGEYGDYYVVGKKAGRNYNRVMFVTGDYFAPANNGKYGFSISQTEAPLVLDTTNGKLYFKEYNWGTKKWEYTDAKKVFQEEI